MTRLLKSSLVVASLLSIQAFASSTIEYARVLHCDYKFQMMPAAQVDIGFWSNNETQRGMMLAFGFGGSAEKKTVTPVQLASNELAHAIVSKEVPTGSLELIIYSKPTSKGDSVLINPHFKQEFWGTCKFRN